VSFCEQCGTYIGPGAKVCLTCGAARTQRGEPETIWFPRLGETPKGSLLATDELLLIPTQGEGLPAQHTTLRALKLRDGSLAWHEQIKHASVSSMASAGDLILVATYSTDLLRGQGALLAFDAMGTARWSCRWQREA